MAFVFLSLATTAGVFLINDLSMKNMEEKSWNLQMLKVMM